MSFNEILEEVNNFDAQDAEMLIEIVKKRLIEQKRQNLEKDVFESRYEIENGKIKSGSIDDLIKELTRE